MLLRRPVKAAAVANLTDARYFAALGVDYLGFALEPGGIPLAEAVAVGEWVSGPRIVAECGSLPVERIAALCGELHPDAVEVGAFARPGEVAEATGLPVLQVLPVGGDLTVDLARSIAGAGAASAYVVDAAAVPGGWGGLRENGSWVAWLRELGGSSEAYLEVGASADDLDDLLAALPAIGLQVRGGEEEAVGVKSFGELDAWFERLEVD